MPMQKSLVYTTATVKETLRYRPPILMIPYETTAPLPVTADYTIPKGALIIPSYYSALHDSDVYPEPETFDSDRWVTGDAASNTKNRLAFGAGPHECFGQRLAMITLPHMIGKAAMELDWKYHPTPQSEECNVVSTMVPMVSSLLWLFTVKLTCSRKDVL